MLLLSSKERIVFPQKITGLAYNQICKTITAKLLEHL